MLSVATATEAHIPLIINLTMQVWPQTYVPIIGEEQVAYMLGRFYSPDALEKQMREYHHKIILCYSNDVPVAFAAYSEIEPQVFKLHKLYIIPGNQGQGIGRFIIEHIIADINAHGAATLRLNVNIHNHAAKAFYERIGFTHFKDEDIDIGNGWFMNDHVLELGL